MAKTGSTRHTCPVRKTSCDHKYAAEQGVSEEEALNRGMEEKSKEFGNQGAEGYSQV